MNQQYYIRKKNFKVPNTGTTLKTQFFDFLDGTSEKRYSLIAFIPNEIIIDVNNSQDYFKILEAQIPLIEGMQLKLLRIGSFPENVFNYKSEIPFEAFIDKQKSQPILIDENKYDLFKNAVQIFRTISERSRLEGFLNDIIKQRLCLDKNQSNHIPDNSLFKIVGYK